MKVCETIKQEITVLCVDDERQILSSLQRCLRDDCINVLTVDCGYKALEILRKQDIDIIISDMRMPTMTGVELLQKVYKSWPNVHRYLLTGYADMSALADAVNLGKIDHFIEKPWDNNVLVEQIQKSIVEIRLTKAKTLHEEQVVEQNKKLWVVKSKLEEKNELYISKIRAAMLSHNGIRESMQKLLLDMVDVHPHLDIGFATAVGKTARNFAKYCDLNVEDINDVELAGQLCEIGLIGANNDLIVMPFNKLNYRFQCEYFEQVGNVETLLSNIPSLTKVTEILSNQFEHVDGTGHPNKKPLQEIPMGSRVLAIARDFWRYKMGRIKDELMSNRSIFIEMRKYKGIRYDGVLLDVLINNSNIISKSLDNDVKHLKDVEPGDIIGSDVYDDQRRLLLPRGHLMTSKCLDKLKRIEKVRGVKFRLVIHYNEVPLEM